MATKMDMAVKPGALEPADKSERDEKAEKIVKAAEIDVDERIDEIKRNNYEQKKFGFSRVSWMIKNYCVIPLISEKLFYSPEFYVRGFYLTKWRMILTRSYISRKSYNVKFSLERLPCEPYVEDAIVDCCIEYDDHHGETNELEFNKTFGVHVTHDRRLFNAGITPINDAHSDVFKIRLEILVRFPGIGESFPACTSEGIRRLSDDLLNLYEDDLIIKDLQLCFLDTRLGVHKAVLLHRLTKEYFQLQITADAESLPLDDFLADPAEKVIRFIYTGDLHHAVTDPAVAVFKFSEVLDIKPIVAYYDPDEILLNSSTEAEEYYTTWTIEDFCTSDAYYLQSPVMINNMMDTKWCLQVYPKGPRRDGNHVYISLKYETKRSKDICAELSLGRPGVRISHTFHRKILPGGVLSGIELVKRDNVINNYMSDDSLTISLRLRMSTGKENISVRGSKSGYKHLSTQRNYDRLSEDILSIYDNERFPNMRLELNDHNIIIYAHQYILHVRCIILEYTLHRRDFRYFRDVNLAVIYELFRFTYSGRIKEEHLALEDTFCLYRTGRYFNFANLQEVILECLHKSLSETNASKIFDFASTERIRTLENAALNILQRNRQ